MDKERSLLLLCLFYFIISWSLVAAGGKGKKKMGGLCTQQEVCRNGRRSPPCRLSYSSTLSPVSMYVCLSSLFDYITWLQQHLNSLFLSKNIEKYCKELKKKYIGTVKRRRSVFADGKERGGEDLPLKRGVSPPSCDNNSRDNRIRCITRTSENKVKCHSMHIFSLQCYMAGQNEATKRCQLINRWHQGDIFSLSKEKKKRILATK